MAADGEVGGGVRRRRSSQYEDDAGQELATRSGPASTYVVSLDRVDLAAPTSADVVALSPVSPTAQAEQTHHVRFSLDVHRDTEFRRSASLSEPARAAPRPPNQPASTWRSSRPPLSVNTEAEYAGQSSRTGMARSPGNQMSPRAGSFTRLSPVSPSGRNRGYSLRRTLFNRNLDGSPRGVDGTSIELEEAGSSTSADRSGGATVPSSPSKKATSPSITIHETAADDVRPRASATPKPKGLQSSPLPHYESWLERNMRGPDKARNQLRRLYKQTKDFILRIQEIPPSKDGRHIDIDPSRKKPLLDERTGKEFLDNSIRSTRYSAWDFLPRQLFAQFRKLANFYFLCVSILQMIPGLSTTGSYTTIIPLIFFISISIGKEGYDDLRRHRLDKAENTREARVLHAYRPTEDKAEDIEAAASPQGGPLHWATLKWRNIKVGDVIKLTRDEMVPADIVLLHSTGPNCIAYIETMALDGETNLKSKMPPAIISDQCATEDGIASCGAHVVVEDPNADLYNFEGRVTVGTETAPLSIGEIIFRGSVLRNTSSAIGIVIYTGEECRSRMNANKHPRTKAPQLQFVVNKIVVLIVCFVLALGIFNTVAYQIWQRTIGRKAWYLTNANVAFFPILTSSFLLFNTMVPLSLYISMEIIKVAQMFLLNDIDMYDEKSDTPFEARTSTINEELGQISYIFSDKTGTLTDNEMKFRKLSVAGTAWLHDLDITKDDMTRLIHKKRAKGKGKARKSIKSLTGDRRKSNLDVAPLGAVLLNEEPDGVGKISEQQDEPKWKSSARPGKPQLELRTREMLRYIQHRPDTAFSRKAKLFLLSIALCHTAIPEPHEDGSLGFQAASPDELALVEAAQELGYLVLDRTAGRITLRYPPGDDPTATSIDEVFQVLDVVEFSSRRKRMSVVIRFPDNRICLICKGADSVIMQRLKLATIAHHKVAEIEKRANRRRSLEAQYAMARKSEQAERRASIGRPSLSLGRPSMGRRSMTASRLQPVRDEIDSWLKEQERDIEVPDLGEEDIYYSPRPSTQLHRPSMAASEPRSSIQFDDWDELVEEALVNDETAVIERCFQHVNDFATEGLRTLLYGYRFIGEKEYASWKEQYLEATTSLVDRTDKIEKVGEVIEQNLDLAGATAIEDKLQSGVPEAIDKLRRANIKIWMLTGDKRETAINIAQSSRIVRDYSMVIILDVEAGLVEQTIAAAIVSITKDDVAHSVVVVDGSTLSMIEEAPSIKKLFFELTILVDSVVCCRASPSQKASLVKSVRKRVKRSVTLAIGDGANDIAMIQEAHVGIGITGKEGLQAARASDYSIAQFRFLTKLLLVHGRWNYVRTCKYILGTFWKEFMFYSCQFIFQRYAGYTGTSLYENWSLSMFNTLFTSLPVIFLGIFERDLAASTLLAVPELYVYGQKNRGFNFFVYLWWLFMAASEAVIIFFTMLSIYGLHGSGQGGDNSLYPLGDLTFTASVIIIWAKIQALEMHSKSVPVLISLVACVGGWFLWNMILSERYGNNVIYKVKNGFIHGFGRDPLWWATVVLIVAAVVLYEIAARALKTAYLPSDTDTFQQLEHDPDVKRRFEEAAADELQQGWHRGTKRSSAEIRREEEEQAAREGQVRELLANRPDGLIEANDSASSYADGLGDAGKAKAKPTTDIQEMISSRFGSVRGRE